MTGRPAAGGIAALVLAASALFLSACSSPTSPELEGGVLATFDVRGERYSIFIIDARAIEQVLALSKGQSEARIPSGRVVKGRESYNAPWSWHIDPRDIQMAEVTMELCDGLPSDVEKDIDYWAGTVGRFCPWSAVLVSLKDYR